MRILLIPRIEFNDGRGSLTVVPLRFMKMVLDNDPTTLFTVAVREDLLDKNWMRNYGWEDKHLDRVNLVPLSKELIGDSTRSRKLGYTSGGALFNSIGPLKKDFKFIDVVISECFASHSLIRVALGGLFSRSYVAMPGFMGWWHWNVTEDSRKDDGSKGDLYNWYDPVAESMGALLCDKVICGSSKTYKQLTNWYRKYFNASYVSELISKTLIIPLGIYIKNIPRGTYLGREAPVVLWSGYYGDEFKNVKAPLLKALMMGVYSKVIFQFVSWPWETSGITEDEAKIELNELKKISKVEVLGPMKELDYHKILSQANVCVIYCEGSYGLRHGEMISAGCMPILNRSTAEIFLGKDYPFACDSLKDLEKFILVGGTFLKKDPYFMPNNYLAKFDLEHNCENTFLSLFREAISLHKTKLNELPNTFMFKLVEDALSGIDKIKHSEAIKKISDKMDKKADLSNHPIFTPGFIRACILKTGYIDTGTFDEPAYRKCV
jgi:hypothetical protein